MRVHAHHEGSTVSTDLTLRRRAGGTVGLAMNFRK